MIAQRNTKMHWLLSTLAAVFFLTVQTSCSEPLEASKESDPLASCLKIELLAHERKTVRGVPKSSAHYAIQFLGNPCQKLEGNLGMYYQALEGPHALEVRMHERFDLDAFLQECPMERNLNLIDINFEKLIKLSDKKCIAEIPVLNELVEKYWNGSLALSDKTESSFVQKLHSDRPPVTVFFGVEETDGPTAKTILHCFSSDNDLWEPDAQLHRIAISDCLTSIF